MRINSDLKLVFNNHSEKTLFSGEGDEAVTYSEILDLAMPQNLGQASSKLVICVLGNSLSGLSGYFGLMLARATQIVADVTKSVDSLNLYVSQFNPAFLWMPHSLKPSIPLSKVVYELGDYILLELSPNDDKLIDPIETEVRLLLPTSGSTGSPKLVKLTDENIWSNAGEIVKYLDLLCSDVGITSLPPSYSFGLSVIHSHALVGASIVVTSCTLFEKAFWEIFKSKSVTNFNGVPYHYEMLERLKFRERRVNDIRFMTQAGGRLSSELVREYSKYCSGLDASFYVMYGQTEASPRMSYIRHGVDCKKPDSIGKAIGRGEFSILLDDGTVAASAGVIGELCYRGPNVSPGYASSKKDWFVCSSEKHRWLRTGDLAYRDTDGDYHLVGRISRYVKVFGHRVSLDDLDLHLSGFGFEAVCGGSDDCIIVYVVDDSVETATQIMRALIEKFSFSKTAIQVVLIDEFPRNLSGKILYQELKVKIGRRIL